MAAHKWWRLTNIAIKTNETNQYISVAELRFNDITTYNQGNILCPSSYPGQGPTNAFDNNANTILHIDDANTGLAASKKWYIGYKFDTDVELQTVSLQMRRDLPDGYDRSWQTADVEYSDDGQTWTKYGTIEPKFAYKDLSLKTVNVIKLASISGKSLQDNGKASRFILIHDWATGDFIQKVIPAADGSWSYSPPNANKLIITHIGEEGFAPQTDAPITPV